MRCRWNGASSGQRERKTLKDASTQFLLSVSADGGLRDNRVLQHYDTSGARGSSTKGGQQIELFQAHSIRRTGYAAVHDVLYTSKKDQRLEP